MQAWREQRQAARRLSGGGAAGPAWGPQQQQPLPPPPQQAVQQQAQQPYWEQPAPTASAGRRSMRAAAAATWDPGAVPQQGPPQQQPWHSGGKARQHPQPPPSMPQHFQQQPWLDGGQVGHHTQQQQQHVQPENFQQQPQAATVAAAGRVAGAAAGASRPALKQAVLVAGGRAYAAPEPQPPSESVARPRGCEKCLRLQDCCGPQWLECMRLAIPPNSTPYRNLPSVRSVCMGAPLQRGRPAKLEPTGPQAAQAAGQAEGPPAWCTQLSRGAGGSASCARGGWRSGGSRQWPSRRQEEEQAAEAWQGRCQGGSSGSASRSCGRCCGAGQRCIRF